MRSLTVACTALVLAGSLALACNGDDDLEPQAPGSAVPGADASVPDASEPAGDEAIELRFEAKVGPRDFSCAESYELGTPATPAWIRDLRMYVSGVALIDDAGARVPLSLEADGLWQTDRIALLDFENGADNCRNGTPETRAILRGRAPRGNYRGVAFELGVPEDHNHADPSLAASPLTLSTMHWSWNAGYIFVRIDAERVPAEGAGDGGTGRGDGGMGHGDGGMGHGDGGMGHGAEGIFLMHLGSTGCTGESSLGENVTCSHENRGAVELTGFDPRVAPITLDVAALFAGSNLQAADLGGSPGCMSSPDDPECAPLFPRLGVDPETGSASAATQQLFHAP